MTWYILYVSYEENGRDYIGAHSTENLEDGYLGPFKDRTFLPTGRIIFGHYKTREASRDLVPSILLKPEENYQRVESASSTQLTPRS